MLKDANLLAKFKQSGKAAVMSGAKMVAHGIDRKKKREAALAQGRRTLLSEKALQKSTPTGI